MKCCLIHEMLNCIYTYLAQEVGLRVYAHLVLDVRLHDLDNFFHISYLFIENFCLKPIFSKTVGLIELNFCGKLFNCCQGRKVIPDPESTLSANPVKPVLLVVVREVYKRIRFCQLLDKYTWGVLAKIIQAIDRSKYLNEVILKIKLLYKSLLCIFNFMGPGYLMSEMIRI